MNNTYEIDQERIQFLADRLLETIEPLDLSGKQDALKPKLVDVISRATDLTILIGRARAKFVVYGAETCSSGRDFDDDWMEPCITHDSFAETKINLIVTPALFTLSSPLIHKSTNTKQQVWLLRWRGLRPPWCTSESGNLLEICSSGQRQS